MARKVYYVNGKKRYLKLDDKTGKIKDNQSFKHAHGQDVRRSSKAERRAQGLK